MTVDWIQNYSLLDLTMNTIWIAAVTLHSKDVHLYGFCSLIIF